MTDEQMIEELEAEQSIFVQTARGMTSDGTSLTLEAVTPSTLYFYDRPQRIVGHMSTADFVELWPAGDNSLEEDPPNAVLAFLEPGDQTPTDAVVTDSSNASPAATPTSSPTKASASRPSPNSRTNSCAPFSTPTNLPPRSKSAARSKPSNPPSTYTCTTRALCPPHKTGHNPTLFGTKSN